VLRARIESIANIAAAELAWVDSGLCTTLQFDSSNVVVPLSRNVSLAERRNHFSQRGKGFAECQLPDIFGVGLPLKCTQ
jgi:hypothetical protein